MSTMLLGCIADDFTGATDLGNGLTRLGVQSVVFLGAPQDNFEDVGTDAIIIALKSRTLPALSAVDASLEALRWLKVKRPKQYYFKYCSTFDSTDEGNIGPVADALLNDLGEAFTVACPAYPANHRTVYGGYLFVDGKLLSESGMRDHPITPMTDSSLVRVLSRQTGGRVGLIPISVVSRGERAIRDVVHAFQRDGTRYAIVDALDDEHLASIALACSDLKMVTGGTGLGVALGHSLREVDTGVSATSGRAPAVDGHAVVLSGSCSETTLEQVDEMRKFCPSFAIDPLATARGVDTSAEALAWAAGKLGHRPLLIYSSSASNEVRRVQTALGRHRSSSMIEQTIGKIARGLVAAGTKRLVIAGGETSGAVVSSLGISGLRIGHEIEPGVPWTTSLNEPHIALALKSGNFGSRDFFRKAFEILP